MSVLKRVSENPTICGIELAFSGRLEPSAIAVFQPFYNSFLRDADFAAIHFGMGSVSFGEESTFSASGTFWKQVVTIRLPSTDAKRAERLELISKAKFLKLKLSNGLDLVIGRNDFNQNTKPKITVKTNIKIAEIEFTSLSIVPTGFVVNTNAINSIQQIPIVVNGN